MKTKNIATYTLVLLAGLSIGIILPGCAGTRIKQLSGTEFQNRAKEIEIANSFNWMTYIGHSHQRAYLESGHPAYIGKGTKTIVLWTPLSELPDELVKKLKAENPPWKPWKPNYSPQTLKQ